ncbi:MAG: response regulator transcription factor [Acidobacteriota bacterium]|nr:response regulator transcription factor [Acidobacteriota bacterium]MDH3786648.1 response regulator transcription factor [Acidobacteriota bacterium]
MTQSIAVLLVDDHSLVREMLVDRLSREQDIQIVGTASNGDDAIVRAGESQPDIVLMDIDMPGTHCFSAARQIRQQCPETRVLYLSAFFNDRYISDALESEGTGYITKDEPPEIVLKAIRLAASGMAYFSPRVQERLVIDETGMSLGDGTRTKASTLTQRELETVRYIARGMSKKEIAALIKVSVKTVEMHTQNAMNKLDIHDRVDLARYAIREGLAQA